MERMDELPIRTKIPTMPTEESFKQDIERDKFDHAIHTVEEVYPPIHIEQFTGLSVGNYLRIAQAFATDYVADKLTGNSIPIMPILYGLMALFGSALVIFILVRTGVL